MDFITAVTQELTNSSAEKDKPLPHDGVVVLAAGEGTAGGPIVVVGTDGTAVVVSEREN